MEEVRWNGGDVTRATVLAVAIIIAAGLIVAFAFGSGNTGFLTDTRALGVPIGVFLLAGQEAVFLLAAWLFSVAKHRAGGRSLGFVRAQGRLPYLKAVGAWLVALAAVAAWSQLITALGWEDLNLRQNAADVIDLGGGLLLSVLVVGIWGPLTEEIFFRGFALTGLRRRFGTTGALVLSAGLFALFHIDPALYVPIFIFGIVLGWLYFQTGSIWPCILAHSLQNTVALLVAAGS